jgi:hypothetical protein
MDLLLTVVLTAAVLALGLWLGARHLAVGEAPKAPTQRAPAEAAPGEGPHLSSLYKTPDFGTNELPDRVTRLEQAVEKLEARLTQVLARAQPLLDEVERAKRELAGVGEELPPVLGGGPGDVDGPGDVRSLAKTLGLDANRREAMAKQFAETLTAIEALEKAHAEVTKEGEVTTIKIGAYGEQASGALQRWRDWVDRSLTPQEKEAYDREHGEASLLGTRAGHFERTVRIDETGGLIQIKESIRTKDGPMDVFQGSAPAAARQLVLEPYSHLLAPQAR